MTADKKSLMARLTPSAISVLTVMIFWGQVQNYMMRLNLSILIVAMVKPTEADARAAASNESCVAAEGAGNADAASVGGTIEWDEFTRGLVLSAFSYGYVTSQIIGGRLAECYGIKLVYGVSMLATAMLTFLSPVVVKWHYAAFIVLRILQARNWIFARTYINWSPGSIFRRCPPIQRSAKKSLRSFPVDTTYADVGKNYYVDSVADYVN